ATVVWCRSVPANLNVEAYVKISRTGLFCLAWLCTCTFVRAQPPQDAATEDQAPAAPQAPAPPPPPAAPQPPAETPPHPEAGRLRLPPPPPKVGDGRMPGEAGYFVGITGWLPIGQSWVDKGHAASFTDPSKLQLAGKSKGAFGAEIGIAVGLHNSVRVSFF